MKPECCGTGTPSTRAGCGSRPSPGSTANMETFMLAYHQQFLHEHGRARRYVVLEQSLACALIGIHRERARVVLIDAHDVAQVAPFRSNELGEPRQHVIGLAAMARLPIERQAGLADDRGGDAALEIARLVPGEEQPGTGAHSLSVMDIGATDANRRDRLGVGHTQPPGGRNHAMRVHLIAGPIALTRSSVAAG